MGARITSVEAFEAKAHFSSLLERVERGEQIIITRHGKPVAKFVPATGLDAQVVGETIAQLRDFAKGQSLGGLSIRELREEGRR
jgi:prevent-host-death family protein